MILKTSSAFAICSSNNVLNLFAVPAHHTSITSPPSRRPSSSEHPASHSTRPSTSRSYATVNHSSPNGAKSSKGCKGTGSPWPTCKNPTPYDIFAIDKAAPYTKARFAELVKQYHPDKHHATALDSLPASTRLERYRLIVLANEILSSPDKRRAYDAWGFGWHVPGKAGAAPEDINEVYRRADKAWRHGYARNGADSPAMNATWEDWERWHERQANGGAERQKPMYMSNASFAALVLAALAVGTVAQTTRMDNSTATFLEKKNAHEANISEALRRQGQAVAGKGREERIERFVRERENINFGFMPSKLDVRPAASTSSPK